MDSNSKKTNTYIKDIENIVASDVAEIHIDDDFLKRYDMGDFEKEIMTYAVHSNMGMTAYQCQNFVARSQLTPWRQVRQAYMELESRYHAYQEIKASLRKAELLRKKWVRDQAEAVDEIAKEMLQVDIDKNDYDITIWKRKMLQAEREINAFLEIVKFYAKTEEDLEWFAAENAEEERKYWIARMGKQAAMDIISFGRIASGNMDSIAMMPEGDQIEALQMATKYAGQVQAGIHNISLGVQSSIDKLLESRDERIPDYCEDAKNIQLTDKPKINGSTIL
jgi:hypothetical protein